jgi:hypothetical protein
MPGSQSQSNLVVRQIPQDRASRPQFLEFVEKQPDHGLHLWVGFELDSTVAAADVSDRGGGEQFTAAGLIHQTLIETLANEVKFSLAHNGLGPQQQPIVKNGQIVDAVEVGQQCAEQGAPLHQIVALLAGTGQAIQLNAQNDADMIQIDLRPNPLVSEALGGGSSALNLVIVDEHHAFRVPAPLDGALAQTALNLDRFFIVCHLERAGLSDINHGEAVEITGLNLGEPAPLTINGQGCWGSAILI